MTLILILDLRTVKPSRSDSTIIFTEKNLDCANKNKANIRKLSIIELGKSLVKDLVITN